MYSLYKDEESSSETSSEPSAGRHCPLLEHTRWHSGVILLPELNADKGNQKYAEHHEQRDNLGVAPLVLAATPLERKKQAYDHRQEDDRAVDIKLLQLLLPAASGKCLSSASSWVVEQHDKEESDGSDWQIDVEAPSPAHSIGEGATH